MGAPKIALRAAQEAMAPSRPKPEPSRAKLITAFAAVYILWGSTFLAIRYAVATLPPFLMAGTRHLVAGAVLYPLARLRSGERPTRANWSAAALLGALLLFGGNGGVSWAEQYVPSGVTALLVASVSLWMVLLEWLRPGGARPTWRVTVGLVLGFSGLVLLVGPGNLFPGSGGGGRVDPLGAIVLVLASLSWATGSIFSRHVKLPRNPLLGTAMQSLAGGALLILVGLLSGQGMRLDWRGVAGFGACAGLPDCLRLAAGFQRLYLAAGCGSPGASRDLCLRQSSGSHAPGLGASGRADHAAHACRRGSNCRRRGAGHQLAAAAHPLDWAGACRSA